MAEGGRTGPGDHRHENHPKKASGRPAEKIFDEYLSAKLIDAGLRKSEDDEGRIWTGYFRVNAKNYREAFVTDPSGDIDILFPSLEARNRALDGDLVAYQLYPAAEFETVEKYLASMQIDGDGAKKVVEKTSLVQKRAHVVGIVERRHTYKAIGCIAAYVKVSQTARLVPLDHRIPHVCLPISQCPVDLTTKFSKYKNMLFAARILEWPATSQNANGEMITQLGTRGDLAAETAAVIESQNINDNEFSEDVLACLPGEDFAITDNELASRRDLRHELVFTIDPDTARDMDDAIHHKLLDDGNVEVGVHIADVSHFVKPDSAIDREASERCTSTYLVNRVIPMLPHRLSNDLCSLKAHEDRLAVSVVWKLSPEGAVLDEWVGRTVIHSRAKLSYRVAQEVLDEPDKEWTSEYLKTDDENVRPMVGALCALSQITTCLRKRRAEKGFLSIRNNDRLSFAMDDKGEPIGCQAPSRYGTQRLIEELMLLANIAVAGELARRRPKTAVLRKHDPPFPIQLNEVEAFGQRVGLPLNTSSVKEMQMSMNAMDDTGGGDGIAHLVMSQKLLRAFKPAKYYTLASMERGNWSQPHYALHEALYTHFTSPIRRYADLLVHRQLLASVDREPEPDSGAEELIATVMRCNDMRLKARSAGESSGALYFAAYVRHAGQVVEDAVIVEVLDRSIDVLLVTYAGTFRVHCNSLDLADAVYCKAGPSLTIRWKRAQDGAASASGRSSSSSSSEQVLKLFMKVKVVILPEERQGNPLSVGVYLQVPEGCCANYGWKPESAAGAAAPSRAAAAAAAAAAPSRAAAAPSQKSGAKRKGRK